MDKSKLISIIQEQVNIKVSELSTWKQVRWEGGRLYFEATRITNEINQFDLELQILYLETLLEKNFIIQDNWPHSAPDITNDFKNWVSKKIASLKIVQVQGKPKSKRSQKTRKVIQYKRKQLLQKQIDSKCPFCGNEDVDHFQIHHIDENRENDSFSNLIMLCANCHSKITKRDISHQRVLDKKLQLDNNIKV